MPTFTRPTAAALSGFIVRLSVIDSPPAPTVAVEFAVDLADAGGAPLGRMAGDLTPFLTAQQVTAFSSAALALYAKAKAELL